MRKVRGRGGEGSLVVRRGFVRSRRESQFAVAAYSLVVPTDTNRLSVNVTRIGQPESRSLRAPGFFRRPA
jgi:hypothetical protein